MDVIQIRELIMAAKTNGGNLLAIEISVKDFKELKYDLCVCPVENSKLPSNEVLYLGVRVVGKLCECGAHPEDWQ